MGVCVAGARAKWECGDGAAFECSWSVPSKAGEGEWGLASVRVPGSVVVSGRCCNNSCNNNNYLTNCR